jgi:hypothetical protein
MHTIKLTVSLSTLRAARTHAAEKDIRYYLNGVYLDTTRGKVVATNGHRMIVVAAPGVIHGHIREVMPPHTRAGIIIPNDAIDSALKLYSGMYARGKSLANVDVPITLNWTREPDKTRDGVHVIGAPAGTIGVPNGGTIGFEPVDGTFPEWRRVMPQPESVGATQPAILNWRLVAEACEAFEILRDVPKNKSGQIAVRIHTRGNDSAIVTDGQEGAVVIIMPLRNDMHADAVPVALREALADTPAPKSESVAA